MELSKEFIKAYLMKQPAPESYNKRKEKGEQIRTHSDGIFNKDLAKTYQPSEPDFVMKYKEENFRPITKTYYQKVYNTISKIERAQDFVINYPENSPGLPDSDQLKPYLEGELHLKKWLFSEFLSCYLKDPNGVLLINAPLNENGRFPEPKLHIFKSESVWYKDEALCIIRHDYNVGTGKQNFILVTAQDLTTVTLDKAGRIVGEAIEYPHGLSFLPVICNGGTPLYGEGDLYESVISGVVPYWDTALVENLDLLAGIKMHVYPEKAVFAKDNCKTCNGLGYAMADNRQVSCNTCNGTGVVVTGMFGVNVMRPIKGNEVAPPDWAPVKYVEKNLNSLEFLQAHIKESLIDGLRAVNMEFLAESPENQSGVSKRYDWEQTHLFLFTIARDLCGRVLPFVIETVTRLRYGVVLSEEKLIALQPVVQIPEKYDVIGADEIEQQIGEARKNEVDSMIIANMEKAYVAKRFSGDSFTINYMTAVIDLDPLRGRTEDDKALILASGGVDKITYFISSNIENLVYKAYLKDKQFFAKDYGQQMDALKAIAEEAMKVTVGTIAAAPNASDPTLETGESIDIEAESKAKLKGTVGGVQGILEIQKSVAEGITQYSSALTLLYEIYGFEDATARALLGDPSKITKPQPVIPANNGPEPGAV